MLEDSTTPSASIPGPNLLSQGRRHIMQRNGGLLETSCVLARPDFFLSDFATKTAYFSLMAAVVVSFVAMLLLTGLHP